MKSKEEIEKLAKFEANDIKHANIKLGYQDEIYYGFVTGYTQCQEDINKEIQSLIDGYKSYILRLEEKFKDTCSALTLEKIVTLESVVENLESKFNKKD